MTAIAPSLPLPQRSSPLAGLAPLATLARRRFQLTTRTPRELLVPLLTPIMFALVIAPALKTALHASGAYESFVAVGTVGLLIPLNTMFAGLGVIVDRAEGAQRELVSAPVPRSYVVFGNLSVALATTAFQVIALIVFAALRGADFVASVTGVAWFVAAAVLFAIGSYGVAETLANKMAKQEEYIGVVPAVAILPWFFAGSLFPVSTLPRGLAMFARVLPLTHALALMRYGLGVDKGGVGLKDIWGMTNVQSMAGLSLVLIAVFAVFFTTLAVKVFARAALR